MYGQARKSYLLYQDIQTSPQKEEQSAQDILYINFEDEHLSSLKAEGYTIEVVPIWKWLLQDNN